MSMLIPGQNQLAEPSIVTVDAFEDLLAEFKTFVVEYVGARSPETAAKLKASLERTGSRCRAPTSRTTKSASSRGSTPALIRG
ncbi:hypothetical protein [Pseudomonas hormoni]